MSPYIVRGEYPDDERGSVYVYVSIAESVFAGRDHATTLNPHDARVFEDVHDAGQWQARLNEEDPEADWTTVDLDDAGRIVRAATMQVHDTALLHGWSIEHRPGLTEPHTTLQKGRLLHAAEPGATAPPKE